MDNTPPPASADVDVDVGPEIREAPAVRTAYRVARDTYETRELT